MSACASPKQQSRSTFSSGEKKRFLTVGGCLAGSQDSAPVTSVSRFLADRYSEIRTIDIFWVILEGNSISADHLVGVIMSPVGKYFSIELCWKMFKLFVNCRSLWKLTFYPIYHVFDFHFTSFRLVFLVQLKIASDQAALKSRKTRECGKKLEKFRKKVNNFIK